MKTNSLHYFGDTRRGSGVINGTPAEPQKLFVSDFTEEPYRKMLVFAHPCEYCDGEGYVLWNDVMGTYFVKKYGFYLLSDSPHYLGHVESIETGSGLEDVSLCYLCPFCDGLGHESLFDEHFDRVSIVREQ